MFLILLHVLCCRCRVWLVVRHSRGYRDALHKFGLTVDASLIVKPGLNFEDGKRAVDHLVNCCATFDVVYTFTDTLAIGAMNRLRARYGVFYIY